MTNWLNEIVDASTTTATVFAGDALNYLIQYFKNVNHDPGDGSVAAKINTLTLFRSTKFGWLDSDQSNQITWTIPDYVENKVISLPTTLGPADTAVFEANVATLSSKTMSSPTLSGTPTLSGYIDSTGITAPSAPASGKIRIYSDSADSFKLKYKKSDNSVVDLTAGGGGGGGDAFLGVAQTFTQPQKFSGAPGVTVYKPLSTVNSLAELIMEHNDTNGAPKQMFSLGSRLTANTLGAESTRLELWIFNAGSWIESIFGDSNGIVIRNNLRLNQTGLTAVRTFTFPDATGVVLTDSATQTISNKEVGNYLDFTRISAPSNPAANKGRGYVKQLDSNNDVFVMILKKGGSYTEVEIA
jgi:hypothetical protein